jgi:hypothetical protein
MEHYPPPKYKLFGGGTYGKGQPLDFLDPIEKLCLLRPTSKKTIALAFFMAFVAYHLQDS